MRGHRIFAVILRYMYFFMRLDHLTDLFFWPALDLFVWGIASVWIQGQDHSLPQLALSMLTALVFWQVIWRSNYEISVNLLQEFWSRNMVNLFSTPLKWIEWVVALMIIGMGKIFITLLFGGVVVALLYSLNIFSVGWALIPFCFSLLISGWFMGFLSAAFVVYFGQRLQMLAWMTGYAFMPFSAVFYPLSALPPWAQMVGKCLPTTYVFEGLRALIYKGVFSWSDLGTSLALNGLYLTGTLVLFYILFEKSRVKGLARLE